MNITIAGVTKEYSEGTTYMDLAREHQAQYDQDIVLAMSDGKLRELFKKVKKDCTVEFVTTGETAGVNAYRRSVTLLLLKAAYKVAGPQAIRRLQVEYSLSSGYYCTIDGEVQVNGEFLSQVKEEMLHLVKKEIPFMKRSVHTDEALEIFHAHCMYDKEKLFRYRRASRVNLYSLDGFEDYYYGYMVPHTGYLKYFDLHLYDEGFVVQFPKPANPRQVPPFEPQHKVFQVLKESSRWGDMLGISTVGDLNDCISHGGIEELILTQEALQEQKLADIAKQIKEHKGCKFVMIAGPSSSGKTTFSHRLSVQLKAQGLRPHPIGVDNYFVERELTPKDEKGDYNFECLGAIELELFNKQMSQLLAGEQIEMPHFNFKTGKKEYNGDFLKLGEEDILVIEGIHCLNDALSYMLPRESKFKIYISALTQLNVDEHNRIPTTDGRLLRRMVRDARTRGTNAARTIQMWPSVRRGEEENIFPYQEEADAMFNSALIYELAVLKQYAEPVLFGIDRNAPEYGEAKRLLKFLDYFVGVDSAKIPNNSIVREFIGGGCFRL
ncbi:MAG: nucleoside kinase [Lachnospiraceae bacterium]|nr:nucleoside kinase [Lachnospiraceae bacterium]